MVEIKSNHTPPQKKKKKKKKWIEDIHPWMACEFKKLSNSKGVGYVISSNVLACKPSY
jgi:hypothetical protein